MTTPIEIYRSADGQAQVEVRFEQETVWLSQAQMAQLFDTSADNISLHLKNIYAEQELDEAVTTEDFSVVRQEGSRQVKRRLKHYNLDAVISVGYRVKSRNATQFRIWATTRLKEYLLQGYTLDRKRLAQNAAELEQALALIQKTAASPPQRALCPDCARIPLAGGAPASAMEAVRPPARFAAQNQAETQPTNAATFNLGICQFRLVRLAGAGQW